MGDALGEGYVSDGEVPVHEVRLPGFRIDATAVTNAMFASFVDATGYRTEAEQYESSAVFHLLLQAPPKDVLGAADRAPWWLNVRGADWAHPGGASSRWSDSPDHPVVHVSHHDALAYCSWAGRRLPTGRTGAISGRGRFRPGTQPRTASSELQPSDHSPPTVTGCMKWPGMSGNGLQTGSCPSITATPR
jgi:sulfatase modifying factor 1